MLIPHEQLSAAALRKIVEEFVTREGTDYGDTTYSLEQKIDSVLKQVRSGEAVITFDEASETCSISTMANAE